MPLRFGTVVLCASAASLAVAGAACGSGSSSSSRAAASPHGSQSPAAATAQPPAPFTPPGGSSSQGTSSGGTYTVQVSLSGSDSLQGSFSQTLTLNPSSPAHCPVPSRLAGSVSGQRIEVQMPSSTSAGEQQLSPGDLQLIVGSHTWGVASAANAPHASTATLQRSSDGSGKITFQDLALQSNSAQQPQESGSITWTCA